MFYIGCDVSDKSSYVYVTDGKGGKAESQEIPTDKDGYRQYFKQWINKSVKVAVEAGGHSRWIHDALKKMAISVYIVNPNKVKLIAKNKKKTDKVDAAFLAKLLRIDELPERVYVAEGDSRELRVLLRSRHQLVTSTTYVMNHLRGMLRQEGIKLKAKAFNDGSTFSRLLANKSVPKHLHPIITSYEKTITGLRNQRGTLGKVIAEYGNKDIELLKSVPGIGEVASKTTYAAISTVTRFKRTKQLTLQQCNVKTLTRGKNSGSNMNARVTRACAERRGPHVRPRRTLRIRSPMHAYRCRSKDAPRNRVRQVGLLDAVRQSGQRLDIAE